MVERSEIFCRLDELAAIIESRRHLGWWRFPTEEASRGVLPVQGFLGTDPLFIVGDQPSTSVWGEDNPNRRTFYGSLRQVGAANAHLTDLYKRRGKSRELENRPLPEDFGEHLEFFRRELAIVQPIRVVALGHLAYQLLEQHIPEIRSMLTRMMHFGALKSRERRVGYEEHMREVLKNNDAVQRLGRARGGDGNRKVKLRYQLAEEILSKGGTDAEIQRRIMEEFPGSKENQTRAQWYRRSWNKYGHCRGDKARE